MGDLEYGLILQQKWEDLAKYIFPTVLRSMPKSERFSLGADIRGLIWEVEEILIQLSLKRGTNGFRLQLLQTVDIKAKTLMAMIRLGIQLDVIPQERYKTVSARLVEIGKIVGGLMKSLQQGTVRSR